MWEIGCSSVPSHLIALSSCVDLLKTLYYEVQVVFWLWIVPVFPWIARKLEVRVGKNWRFFNVFRPSEVVFPVVFDGLVEVEYVQNVLLLMQLEYNVVELFLVEVKCCRKLFQS